MRKLVTFLAALGSALTFATPAAAQFFPSQPYAVPFGYAYGHGDYRQVRSLRNRVYLVERQIDRLDRRGVIRDRLADRLRWEVQGIERRLRFSARNGLHPYEARDIHIRLARLEQRIQFAVSNRFGRHGHNGYYSDDDRRWADGRDHDWERDDNRRRHRDRDDDEDDD